MVTGRMRRRQRLLDAYVRIEFEDRGVLPDDGRDRSQPEPFHEVPETAELGADSGEDAREDLPA